MEASAKTSFNAKKLFNEVGKILLEEYNSIMDRQLSPSPCDKSFTTFLELSEDESNTRRKKCIC